MHEIVMADKKLIMCWQRPDWTFEDYTREFQARTQVAEEAGSLLGLGEDETMTVYKQRSVNYDKLLLRVNANEPTPMADLASYQAEEREQYLAILH